MTRIAVSALALVLLSACSMGDEYVRPATPPPAGWKNAAQGNVWPGADWWRQFGSARLDELMARARAANFDLAAATARVRQADAQLGIAGASLLPSVSASASETRARGSQAASTSSVSKARHTTTSSATLTASYEIDFWGKNAAAVDAAQAAAEASRFDLQTATLTAQSGVATTYFEILGLAERIRLVRESITNSEGILAVFRDRQRAGTATSLDVAQQESVLATQRATLAPMERQMRQDYNALAILTGRMPEEFGLVPETLADLRVPVVGAGLPSELLARRPDVQSAEASLRAANADIAAARAAWFPAISLTGTGGFQSLDLMKMMTAQSLLWSVASSATQVIFDGGKIAGTVEQKRARFEELSQTYRKAVASSFSDVENALIAVEKAVEEVEAQRVAEATSRRAFEIAQAQMAGGIVDVTTVLNTQKTLFTAQDSLAQARLSQLQAIVGLYKALGGGWKAG
ncbi:RND efflux system outer membrane lipoprotein NodT family [Paramagnetospirillum magnetotacticum MS-1]|uniref:RND efflux system outer membrane lipoprotein NodT family n=1 Tax=Paramagnetospirillum magnetotacticum MS-1 TaxID=272627 RepID=A0A0C2YXL7_PARME|nr:efflux transporter outer membrane subunit [Paramagnetospirillum magnetotacticum]KIL99858.1 RND efflux system outer membrane lipoprotein NodT family [Paramagnetospirillum magnetotacticum MS-1]